MSENNNLLNQLQQMLHWKKSKKFYAEKLGITEFEIDELLSDIRRREQAEEAAEIGNYISELEDVVVTGYGSQKRKELTGAVVTVNPIAGITLSSLLKEKLATKSTVSSRVYNLDA
jgi:hypothetical protein